VSNGNDPYAAIGARVVGGGAIRGSQYDAAQAKAQADLEYQRTINARQQEELERLRKTPLPQAPKSSQQQVRETIQSERAKEVGQAVGKAEVGLAGAEQTAMEARRLLRQLMGHEGFSGAVGLKNPFKGGFGFMTIPGTSVAGFESLLGQAKGGAFLQAVEKMKGSGSLSEAEGKAATAAITRMSTSTSESDFRAAAADFDRIIAGGLDVTQKRARMGSLPYSYEQLRAEQERRAARKR